MKKLSLFLILLVFVFSNKVAACQLYMEPERTKRVQEAIEKADYIFSARVLGYIDEGDYANKIVLKVITNYKNKVERLIPIINDMSDHCNLNFRPGQVMTVIAVNSNYPDEGVSTPSLLVSKFSRYAKESELTKGFGHPEKSYSIDPELIPQKVFVTAWPPHILKGLGLEYKQEDKNAIMQKSIDMIKTCENVSDQIKPHTGYTYPILKISYVDDLDIKISDKTLKFNSIDIGYDKENSKIFDEVIIYHDNNAVTLSNCDVPELSDLFEQIP